MKKIESVGMYVVGGESKEKILDFVRSHYCGVLEVADKSIPSGGFGGYLDKCSDGSLTGRRFVPWVYAVGDKIGVSQ